MIAHIVLFRPKAEVEDESIRSFATEFRRVCLDVPGIERVRVGLVTAGGVFSGSNIGSSTYSVAAYLEFNSRDALEAYLQHPLHREFAESFWSYSEETVIADAIMADPKTEDISSLWVKKPN